MSPWTRSSWYAGASGLGAIAGGVGCVGVGVGCGVWMWGVVGAKGGSGASRMPASHV